jgi:Flp pilus assembly pilin Flp
VAEVRNAGKEEIMLSNIKAAILRFVAPSEGEEGQTLAEYGLVLALVSVASIVALGLLGASIIVMYGDITAVLP